MFFKEPLAAATHTLDELITRALDKIGELVDSAIGFFHFVEADQKTLSLQQWSIRTLNEFCRAEGKGLHYPIEQAGVWATMHGRTSKQAWIVRGTRSAMR
ncbi:MAG: hypothetical protein R6U27_07735 [Desulfobacterales bacterium]